MFPLYWYIPTILSIFYPNCPLLVLVKYTFILQIKRIIVLNGYQGLF